jgi:hypothetical protein
MSLRQAYFDSMTIAFFKTEERAARSGQVTSVYHFSGDDTVKRSLDGRVRS